MTLTKDKVLAITRDPSVSSEPFDEEIKQNFIEIWEKRRMMAVEYDKREDYRVFAESVLDFVRDRRSSDLRLYTSSHGPEILCFLFDTRTDEFIQMV